MKIRLLKIVFSPPSTSSTSGFLDDLASGGCLPYWQTSRRHPSANREDLTYCFVTPICVEGKIGLMVGLDAGVLAAVE
jgi:hypothetical protein